MTRDEAILAMGRKTPVIYTGAGSLGHRTSVLVGRKRIVTREVVYSL